MAVKRYLGENYGSLISIEYAPTWQFLRFKPGADGKISAADIEFYSGYTWQNIYCTQDTMGHRQQQASDVNGDPYTQSVVGFIPGDEDHIEQPLADLHGRQRYLLRITRPNGVRKIVGTIAEPLEITLDSNSQTTIPGRAGTAITFNGKTLKRALTLTV